VQALEADSIRLQHEMVACGGGFAITAATLMGQDARRLAAVRITRPTLWRSIVLGVTAHRPHTLATRSVANLIRSMATAIAQGGLGYRHPRLPLCHPRGGGDPER